MCVTLILYFLLVLYGYTIVQCISHYYVFDYFVYVCEKSTTKNVRQSWSRLKLGSCDLASIAVGEICVRDAIPKAKYLYGTLQKEEKKRFYNDMGVESQHL